MKNIVDKKELGKYDVGVIIGRFQVDILHEAHTNLIDMVVSNHKKAIIFLGVSAVLGSVRNSLDFESREKMIHEKYPNVIVLALPDQASNALWSGELDRRIREVYQIGKVVLYGGRDSFIPYYEGSFDVTELEQELVFLSGTEIRKEISSSVKSSAEWRAGVIYGLYNTYSTSFQTVDIACFSENGDKILLAKKPRETKYRLVGGFVDPSDASLEAAARREFSEEVQNTEVSPMKYVTSSRIDDWRYRSDRNKIMTAVFVCKYIYGSPRPSDDISEVRWFDTKELASKVKENIVEEHVFIVSSALEFVKSNPFTKE